MGWRRSMVRRALGAVGASALLATALVVAVPVGAGGQEAPAEPVSYEAVASAEGVRLSWGAPGFVAVDTFVDGGGPVSQAVIDGLGNSQAFASLPYPGDLAISGPGLVAGLTGLPSPPPYPFYVSSSHPTVPEQKLSQPGYELAASSSELESVGSTMTGGGSGSGSGASSVGSTVTRARTGRDATSGVVTAEATGSADVVNIGGVLRIGQVDAKAKVSRGPGAEPRREADFVINGMTIAGQTVGFSEEGFSFGEMGVPIPPGDPLLEVLEEAQISVRYLARVDHPDGVVSPGLVVTQEREIPGGPTMVFRYTFGRMAASATVSGSATSIGDVLAPVGEAPAETEVTSPPVEPPAEEVAAPPATTPAPAEVPPVTVDDAGGFDSGSFDAGVSVPEPAEDVAAPVAPPAPAAPVEEEAAPIVRTPTTRVDVTSVYLILVVGAAVALAGGSVLRLVGVKLKWTS